jgi:hypothetical protein
LWRLNGCATRTSTSRRGSPHWIAQQSGRIAPAGSEEPDPAGRVGPECVTSSHRRVRLGAYYATWALPCAFWPASPALAPHEPDAAGAPPILVVDANVDTQAPYQWSVDMAAQLDSAVLLTREGTGHPSYLNSACVEDAVNACLVDLILPPADLICSSRGGLFERFA